MDLTTGETVTASALNVMVRDDFRFLYSPPGFRAYHEQEQPYIFDTSLGAGGAYLYSDSSVVVTDTDGMHGQTAERSEP